MIIAKSGRKYRKVPDGLDVEIWDAMSPLDRLKYLGLIESVNKSVVLVISDWIDARWLINNALASIDSCYAKGSQRHNEMLELHKKLEKQLISQVGEDYLT